MNVIYRELKRYRKPLFYWTLLLFFFIAASYTKMDTLKENYQALESILNVFPQVFKSAFGLTDVDASKASFSLNIVTFYVIIMGSLYALFLGSGIFAYEEAKKTAEFLLTKPRTRLWIYIRKLLAAIILILIFLIIALAINYGSLLITNQSQLTWLLLRYTIMLFIILFFFFSLGVMLSVIFRKMKHGQTAAMILFGLFFMIMLLFDISREYIFLRHFTPFKIFNLNDIENQMIPYKEIIIMTTTSLIALIIGYFLYKKREIL